MRAEYDAVLIGPGTALADDPELTVRMVKGRNPKRIVIDPKLFLPLSLKLFMENPEKNVFLVTTKTSIKENPGKAEELIKAGIHLVPLAAGKNGRQNPLAILKALGKLKIASVLVEGGSGIYTSFMRANAVDELCLFISPRLLGNGMAVLGDLGRKKVSQAPLWQIRSYESSGSDIKIVLRK
jgi:riboflavin-specific deaminase-like protein